MLCRHFKTLCRKNWILWKRNLCASLCEILFPIFLILMILVIRVAISKKDRTSDNQISTGQVYRVFESTADTSASGTSRYFMNLESSFTDMFSKCYETNEGRFDARTRVGLSPPSASNSVASFIKNQIEYSAGATSFDLTVKEFADEAAMISYVSSSSYEMNDNEPGLCFGIAIT